MDDVENKGINLRQTSEENPFAFSEHLNKEN